MLPWLIVSTGWSAITVVTVHALLVAGTRFLLPLLGVSAAALVGSLVGLRFRLRPRRRGATPPPPPPSTPSTS